MGISAGFGYENRLKYIGDIGRFDLQYRGVEPSDMMYVYLVSFPNDEILTGMYYHNAGNIRNYDANGPMKEQTVALGDTGEVWAIKHMTFSDFKKFVKKQKVIQDKLDIKYPNLIIGGRYGYRRDVLVVNATTTKANKSKED